LEAERAKADKLQKECEEQKKLMSEEKAKLKSGEQSNALEL
jgi:hypothetical protein